MKTIIKISSLIKPGDFFFVSYKLGDFNGY